MSCVWCGVWCCVVLCGGVWCGCRVLCGRGVVVLGVWRWCVLCVVLWYGVCGAVLCACGGVVYGGDVVCGVVLHGVVR